MTTEPHNWLSCIIPLEWENRAKQIRERRDQLYGNIFEEESTDLRWVGDLGEICFNAWLKEHKVTNFQWHLDNAAGKPDFTIGELSIDVKTVKRKVPPRPDYTAQITARHKDHPIDELFFLSYEFASKKLWMLGGIKMVEFIRFARYYGEGEFVHKDYQIRRGHEIYNGKIDILTAPAPWIHQFEHL